jgi:DNA invertase Pin-like site-specific DNA recombinase
MLVGYARVSTTHQNLEPQIKALSDAGCTEIFKEKKSGTTKVNRAELAKALQFVRKGDTFVVNRLDRFARSIKDMNDTIQFLQNKGVGFKAIEQGINIPCDGSADSMGKLMLNILGSFAEFETDIRKERQMDGIKNALKKGTKFGREKKFSFEKVEEALKYKEDNELTNKQVAEHYNIGLKTFQTYLKEYKEYKKKQK